MSAHACILDDDPADADTAPTVRDLRMPASAARHAIARCFVNAAAARFKALLLDGGWRSEGGSCIADVRVTLSTRSPSLAPHFEAVVGRGDGPDPVAAAILVACRSVVAAFTRKGYRVQGVYTLRRKGADVRAVDVDVRVAWG